MAVPKKRTSKTKKKNSKTVWKNKAKCQAIKAFSLSQSILKKSESKSNSSKELPNNVELES